MNEQNNASVNEKVLQALSRVDRYFDRIVPWLANLYDPETKGFYMTLSGKQDPEMAPAIEMTAWAISILKTDTDAFASMPADFREALIRFFDERQDPETGVFIDKQGPANPRETARNQGAALGAYGHLGAAPARLHPSKMEKNNSTDTAVMPAYMETPETYLAWVKGHNWDTNSWTAGDQTQSSQQYIAMLPPERQEAYKKVVLDFLAERQFESGLYSPNFDFNAASGAFKVGLVYAAWGLRLPNHEKIIDSIFKCYEVSKTTSPFFVRNPISVLVQMSAYSHETKVRIQKLALSHIDQMLASFGEFICPDGAFSARKGAAMISFGGVVGSHGGFEGDIDATKMMLIARKQMYTIFDLEAPALPAEKFWDWIYGKEEIPNLYRD